MADASRKVFATHAINIVQRLHGVPRCFDMRRARILMQGSSSSSSSAGPVVYWMSRDQRVQDNWALVLAQQLANEKKLPLCVVFCLVPKFLDATIRHFLFMLGGLSEVGSDLRALNIRFELLKGFAVDVLPSFVAENNVDYLVTDLSVLRTPLQWVQDVRTKLEQVRPSTTFYQVDAHNVVPVWEASSEMEAGAFSIRPKIRSKLDDFLTPFISISKHVHSDDKVNVHVDMDALVDEILIDRKVGPVQWARPGAKNAMEMLQKFCRAKIHRYATLRNEPNEDVISNLAPWLHFGHISGQRCVLYSVRNSPKGEGLNEFIEQCVVRRELADNYCFYQPKYDSLEGTHAWAIKTLNEHRGDDRRYSYSLSQFEGAETHDKLWNAAQVQMIADGKMHCFMRMYWAKKILEWSSSPEEALATAVYLNDRYSLDGRDPNGYTGIMWCIGGLHDKSFPPRPIYGRVRYMSYEGCQRKFDVARYVRDNLRKKQRN